MQCEARTLLPQDPQASISKMKQSICLLGKGEEGQEELQVGEWVG